MWLVVLVLVLLALGGAWRLWRGAAELTLQEQLRRLRRIMR